MNYLVEYWFLIVGLACVIALGFTMVVKFEKMPKDVQKENLKEWLKLAVVKAEGQLGAKTGQLKLRLVYDWAVEKFPWVCEFITFETFSLWVDDALDWMTNTVLVNKVTKDVASLNL